MKIELENVLPAEIEKRSFEIITEELGDRVFDPLQEPIIKRAIHTSADFEYADSLCFSEHAVEKALDALRKGAYIVTDTQMGKSGINKKVIWRRGLLFYVGSGCGRDSQKERYNPGRSQYGKGCKA